MNEKIGGVEGTKLDDDFVEMERVSRRRRSAALAARESRRCNERGGPLLFSRCCELRLGRVIAQLRSASYGDCRSDLIACPE